MICRTAAIAARQLVGSLGYAPGVANGILNSLFGGICTPRRFAGLGNGLAQPHGVRLITGSPVAGFRWETCRPTGFLLASTPSALYIHGIMPGRDMSMLSVVTRLRRRSEPAMSSGSLKLNGS